MKLAKQVTGRPHVVVFEGSFHGRTHLAMAMTTSKTSYRAGHAPLPAGVFVAPFARSGRGRRRCPRRPPQAARHPDRAGGDGGDDHRARARRGRLPPGPGAVPRRHRRALPRARDPVRRRRGADRLRSHRRAVLRRAPRHRARRAGAGQGPRQRVPHLGHRRQRRAHGPLAGREPRGHLRRQPDRLRRRPRHHRRGHRSRLPRRRAGTRPASWPTGCGPSWAPRPRSGPSVSWSPSRRPIRPAPRR